jgi:hypothetical protein
MKLKSKKTDATFLVSRAEGKTGDFLLFSHPDEKAPNSLQFFC